MQACGHAGIYAGAQTSKHAGMQAFGTVESLSTGVCVYTYIHVHIQFAFRVNVISNVLRDIETYSLEVCTGVNGRTHGVPQCKIA